MDLIRSPDAAFFPRPQALLSVVQRFGISALQVLSAWLATRRRLVTNTVVPISKTTSAEAIERY